VTIFVQYITYNLKVYNTCGLNGVNKQPEINNKNRHNNNNNNNNNNAHGDVTQNRTDIIIENKEEKTCF